MVEKDCEKKKPLVVFVNLPERIYTVSNGT